MRLIILLLFLSLQVSAQPITDIYKAHYIKNYDGDTFTAYVELPAVDTKQDFVLRRVKCRIYLADTYELRDSRHRYEALRAKNVVRLALENGPFFVRYFGKDKYGRWLTRTYYAGDNRTLKKLLKSQNLLTGKYERMINARQELVPY